LCRHVRGGDKKGVHCGVVHHRVAAVRYLLGVGEEEEEEEEC